MPRKTWAKGATLNEVVDMYEPAESLRTYEARDRKGRLYSVEVFRSGEFAGDVHRVDGVPKTRNCFKQSAEQALNVSARWWGLAKAFNGLEEVGA